MSRRSWAVAVRTVGSAGPAWTPRLVWARGCRMPDEGRRCREVHRSTWIRWARPVTRVVRWRRRSRGSRPRRLLASGRSGPGASAHRWGDRSTWNEPR
ncbi:hypothetical protein FTX61_07560 [Nitriliruptoraceae bacterium ZYF776]|nr:hypothetical protein [Profundirhabdus halotolerans]